jgi:putative YhdH/YhfP family quinone oxidoreductase
LVTGYDLGMNTHGGLGEYVRVPAAWVVSLPKGLSAAQSMAFGTAGFTAALSMQALRDGHAQPDQGEVLVTGATGGVGSLAVLLLSRAGFRVIAATGKADAEPMLLSLGAAGIISREDVLAARSRPMAKARWAHVIDTVGGDMLDAGLRATCPRGVVTTCGMVASAELATNVFPFILRGVRLQGIDSAATEMQQRLEVWQGLVDVWTPAAWERLVREIVLTDVQPEIEAMELLGDVAAEKGELQQAAMEYGAALTRVRNSSWSGEEQSLLEKLAGVLMDQGDLKATAPLVGALSALEESSDSLKVQARYSHLNGDPVMALELMERARELAGLTWEESDQNTLDAYRDKSKRRLVRRPWPILPPISKQFPLGPQKISLAGA